jgi:hypothetical protein
MTVLIGFSTRKYNPVSALVRWITGAKASHAWVMYPDQFFHDRLMVMEATEWGVREISADIFWKRNVVVAVFKPEVDMTEAVRMSGPLLGELYDFLGLIGMPIVIAAAKWLHKKITNPLESPSGLFCSELVMKLMKIAQHPGTESLSPSESSPDLEMRFLTERKVKSVMLPKSAQECYQALS